MVIINSEYSNIDENRITDLVNFILKLYDTQQSEVSISFCNDDYIKELNSKYRNKNVSTDVLSFAMQDGEYMGEDNMLGDIVISVDTAITQSKELNHPLFIEIDHLLTHGMLHLLGYDHIEEKDKIEMFNEHKEILKSYYTKTDDTEYITDNWLLY